VLGALLLILGVIATIVGLGSAVSGLAEAWIAKLPEGVPLILERLRFLDAPLAGAIVARPSRTQLQCRRRRPEAHETDSGWRSCRLACERAQDRAEVARVDIELFGQSNEQKLLGLLAIEQSADSAMVRFSPQLVMQRELPLRDSDDEDQDQLDDVRARQQENEGIGVPIGREADADPDKLQDDRSPAPPAHRHGRYSPTNVLGWG
jgi:hypothetical protein